MKLLPPLSLALAASVLLSSVAFAVTPLTQLLTEAQTAYQRGETATAKAKFESVLSMDPKNPVAIGFLRQIKVKEAASNANPEVAFSRLILPSVQFKEAQFSAVLDSLKQQSAKLSDGKQVANFVVQVPEPQASTPITLSLTNVPFTEVLKYIGSLASVSFTYDKYAISVRPAGGTAKTEPTQEAAK